MATVATVENKASHFTGLILKDFIELPDAAS